jgi:hypothetical protein
MTVSLKHAFASGKTDGADATLVQPSNWNAEHSLQLATNKLLGRVTAGTGAAEEIALPLATTYGGTGLTSFTANGVVYASSSSALTTGSALTFDGTNLGVGGSLGLNTGRVAVTLNASTDTILSFGRGGSLVGYILQDATGQTFYNGDNTFQRWYVNAVEQMRLTSTGLGIGTSSPGAKLEVYTAGTTNLRLNGSLGGGNTVDFFNYIPAVSNDGFSISIGGTNRLSMTNSGNLGLGVTPSAWISSWKVLQLPGVSLSSSSIIGIVGQNWYINSSGADTYITTGAASAYKQTAATHTWLVAPSGTGGTTIPFDTVMTLDVSGNLGLGVTPSARTVGKAIEAGQVGNSLWGVSASNVYVTANTTYNGAFRYGSNGFASFYVQNDSVHSWHTAPSGTAGNAITFTQAMTLDASGNLLVGQTTSGPLNVNGVGIAPASTGGVDFNHVTGTASGILYARFNYAGSAIGSITQSGTTAVLYNVTSDQRLKENIVDAPEFGSVIDALQVRSYDWKTDQTHQRAGFVAQELVTVAPEAVHQPADPDEMMAVDYSKLVPMLVKEIQSLRIRITQLENKL